MAATTETHYWKVIGSRQEDDGTFTHFMKQVADYEGNPLVDVPPQRAEENRQQEVPRGTIVKLVVTTNINRQFTLNPTS